MIIIGGGSFQFALAQHISASDLKQIRAKEDSLRTIVRHMYLDTLPTAPDAQPGKQVDSDNPFLNRRPAPRINTASRLRNDSLFIRTLVRALRLKNSFGYPFDSLAGISHLYAPDSSFRIFTWNLQYNESEFLRHGAIQMRTPDGSLKLYNLRDISDLTDSPLDSIRTKDNWIGSVYYNIIRNTYRGKNYYTLFGINEYLATKKKWIEVLTFNNQQMPEFGGIFDFSKDSVPKQSMVRYFIEYKREASALVNYVDEQGMILLDHLTSEENHPDLPYTMVPDGDSEGFQWKDGKWMHVEKVFHYKQDMRGVDPMLGNPPMGDPILDKDSNINGEKLDQHPGKTKVKVKKKG